MFIPATKEEIKKLGWKGLEIILVTGDAYIDSSFIGAAVIGKVLLNAGYRVGIIAQPDINSPADITRLGEPEIFWGITAGCMDSMVSNYTALKKKRRRDDLTPGGINSRRPDRASIVYSNLIRRYFKNTKPLVLGGIESSLRRVSHYDYWDDKIRKPLLFDAKADILVYGMGEKAVLELASKIKNKEDYRNTRGICYISKDIDTAAEKGYLILPSFEDVSSDKQKFIEMFGSFYNNNDPLNARGLIQEACGRYLIQNPPPDFLLQNEIDAIYGLDFEREVHPYYAALGEVRALDTIRNSVTTHRGCYGECNFCSIAVHQGRVIQSRSESSILKEVKKISGMPGFKGYIQDIGGPTANMYGTGCGKLSDNRSYCREKRCLYPEICKNLNISHKRQVDLLRKMRKEAEGPFTAGIKKVFVTSGIRYDIIMNDKESGDEYLKELSEYHISGQLKIAPEHSEDDILAKMGKPSKKILLDFKNKFDLANKKSGKKQFLTYYLIAAHPGCSDSDMLKLKMLTRNKLHIHPEQVQIFMPTPSTYSALMYYTEFDPFKGENIFVEKDQGRKEKQKMIVTAPSTHDLY